MCLPVQRRRRSAMMRRTTGSGVTARKWCGLDERSISPSTPSALNRATHLRKARGLIPPSHEARSGLSPLSTSRTNRSRPRGICLAFLWTFILSLLKGLKFGNSSFLHRDQQDNLLKEHIYVIIRDGTTRDNMGLLSGTVPYTFHKHDT